MYVIVLVSASNVKWNLLDDLTNFVRLELIEQRSARPNGTLFEQLETHISRSVRLDGDNMLAKHLLETFEQFGISLRPMLLDDVRCFLGDL